MELFLSIAIFNNAIQAAREAYQKRNHEEFVKAVELAKFAIPEHPTLAVTLTQAIKHFPAPEALEKISFVSLALVEFSAIKSWRRQN